MNVSPRDLPELFSTGWDAGIFIFSQKPLFPSLQSRQSQLRNL